MDDSKRRSMEIEERPLPDGWIRQFDPTSQHHFYVSSAFPSNLLLRTHICEFKLG